MIESKYLTDALRAIGRMKIRRDSEIEIIRNARKLTWLLQGWHSEARDMTSTEDDKIVVIKGHITSR